MIDRHLLYWLGRAELQFTLPNSVMWYEFGFHQHKITIYLFIFNHAPQPLRLIVRSGLDVPTFATRSLHTCHHARAPSGGRWNCGREMSGKFCLNADLHVTFRDLLHAVKLRHETDGFTSPPKEGVLRIFFALKIQWLQPGLNLRTWVPKASTLPLDHRSCFSPMGTEDYIHGDKLAGVWSSSRMSIHQWDE